MIEIGQVIKAQKKKALVRLKRTSRCGECQACKTSENSGKEMFAEAVNTMGAKVGDWVKISVEPKYLLQVGLAVYLLPLGGFLLGILGGFLLATALGFRFLAEGVSFFSGLFFMVLSGFFLRSYSKKVASKCEPVIKGILPKYYEGTKGTEGNKGNLKLSLNFSFSSLPPKAGSSSPKG